MDFSQNIVVEWIELAVDYAIEYKKLVLVGFLVLSGATGGFFWHRWNAACQSQRAHKELVEVLKLFEAPVVKESTSIDKKNLAQFYSESEKWENVASACSEAYKSYSRTAFAPFFLVYQSEALLNIQKKEAALLVLKQAFGLFKGLVLRDFLRVKMALISMDCQDKELQQKGFEDLKRLAEDSDHAAHEQALYYLGLYYWNNNEFSLAKNYWQQMLVKYAQTDVRSGGVYTELVKPKLALITVEN